MALVLSAFFALMVIDGLVPALLILGASVYLLARARCIRDWAFLAKITAALSLFVFAANFLLARLGGEVYWEYGPVPILGVLDLTSVEVMMSLTAAVKLIAVVSVFLILTLTIHPDGLFSLFSRRLPRSTGLFLSLTAVLYPTMARDASAVADAHRSRGLEMDSGGIVRRARARFPIVRPMFANAMERSLDLGEAMAARGWGRKGAKGRYGPGGAASFAPRGTGMPVAGAGGRAGTMLHWAAAMLVFISVAEMVSQVSFGAGSALSAGPFEFTSALATIPPVALASSPAAIVPLLPFAFIVAIVMICAAPSLARGTADTAERRTAAPSRPAPEGIGGGEAP